jgi:hypothetical protein
MSAFRSNGENLEPLLGEGRDMLLPYILLQRGGKGKRPNDAVGPFSENNGK